MGVAVRPRTPDDLPALLALLQRTHESDGYPVRASRVSAAWLAPDDELAAWVALDGDRPVGHGALHPAGGASLPLWREATGREADGLAVVSRLYTDRSAPGAGTALLEAAVAEARARGRAPVLEVLSSSPARGFYARRGWRRVGEVPQRWGDVPVVVDVLVAPDRGATLQA